VRAGGGQHPPSVWIDVHTMQPPRATRVARVYGVATTGIGLRPPPLTTCEQHRRHLRDVQTLSAFQLRVHRWTSPHGAKGV
jgi:hypothetical protein